jgi:hypothetical protein
MSVINEKEFSQCFNPIKVSYIQKSRYTSGNVGVLIPYYIHVDDLRILSDEVLIP